MTQYIELRLLIEIVAEELKAVKSIEELHKWLDTDGFKDHIKQEVELQGFANEEEALLKSKLELMESLIKELEKFEDTHRELQLDKFKQLERYRKAADLFIQVEGTLTGRFVSDINPISEVRKCKHHNCDEIFPVEIGSTKLYCSSKCRENAKKWRQRHGEQ